MRTGGRTGGLSRRAQRGAATPRVLLALVASTVVTAAVAGPMAYQAHEARQATDTSTPITARPSTTSTTTTEAPASAPPSAVLPETEERGGSVALGPPTTEGRASTTRRPPSSGPGRTTTTRPPATSPTTAPGSTVVTGPGTTSPPPATSVPTGDVIVWTRSWESRANTPVAGATVSGTVFIYLLDAGTAGLTSARFWVDDPDGAGAPIHLDPQAPFTLLPGPSEDRAGGLDTTTLADGEHSVLVELVFGTTTTRRIATFAVANG